MALHQKHGNRYRRKNRITGWLFLCHPASCMFYLSTQILLVLLFNHPLFVATVLIGLVCNAVYHLGAQDTCRSLKSGFLFCFLISLLNPLLNHRGAYVLSYLFDRPITLEAVAYSFYLFSLLASMIAVFVLINQMMGSGKVLYLFSRVLPQTGFIVSMTLRFSGLFRLQASGYSAIQTNRKKQTGSLAARIGDAASVFGGFTTYSLENGLKTAQYLRASEYGTTKRSLYLQYQIRIADVIFLIIVGFFCIVCVIFRLQGAGQLDYYKNLSEIALRSNDWLAYLLLMGFQLMPYLIDLCSKYKERASCYL